MCNIQEAKRHETLAELFMTEGNVAKAMEHYLEATGIYVLNIQLLKQESLLDEANRCYHIVERLRGEKGERRYSKEELAKRTLQETNSISPARQNHHHHNDLEEIGHLLNLRIEGI